MSLINWKTSYFKDRVLIAYTFLFYYLKYVKGCYEDRNRFGYTVTEGGIVVGDSANYSCWPGYTHVAGNLNRTCLPTLVLSGRRPTCELANCTSIVRQKCLQCKARTNGVCSSQSQSTSSLGCLGALQTKLGVSVAMVDSYCYKYECTDIFDFNSPVETDGSYWTARYTCARGILISFHSNITSISKLWYILYKVNNKNVYDYTKLYYD